MSPIRARRSAAFLVAMALACAAVPALAATKHGVTPTAPAKNAVVAVGTTPAFTGTVSGRGKVFVHVSTSRKRDAAGLIGDDAMVQKAKRTGSAFKTTARSFDFPDFWLNTPGTYFWQAHRVACKGRGKPVDCSQEGPIVAFTVG